MTTKPPPGKRELLPAPGRELHRRRALGQPVERQAERVVGGQRGEGVLRLVARREREADPAAAEGDVRAVVAELDVHRPDAADLDVVPEMRVEVG